MITTKVVEIKPGLFASESIRIFTTLEGNNPGGSIKDHLVRGELEHLMAQGVLRKKSLISEVSAGSTALSLAFYCRRLDLQCHLFLPFETPLDVIEQLGRAGAYIHLEDRKKIYEVHEEFCGRYKAWPLNQLGDEEKKKHYHLLGRQIYDQKGAFQVLIGAVGTGHSLKGVGAALKPDRILTAEPEPQLQISGIRNLLKDRYGEKDCCRAEDFDERILVTAQQADMEDVLETESGSIRIGPSFKIVLAAIRKQFLNSRDKMKIFALGANNRFSQKNLVSKQAA